MHVCTFSESFVEKRQRRLALWAQHVTAHPTLVQARPLAIFLCGAAIPPMWKNALTANPTLRHPASMLAQRQSSMSETSER